MSAHSNREKQVLLHVHKEYKGLRMWRFDVGHAYAVHSVMPALKEALLDFIKNKSFSRAITIARNKLIRLSYGTVGYADLSGLYHGIHINIEIKVGKDRQSDEQKTMETTINKAGGVYILLDDKSSIESQLTRLDSIRDHFQG